MNKPQENTHEKPATSQKSVLGKGLASLFPQMGTAAAVPPPAPATAQPETAEWNVAAGAHREESSNRDRHPGISIAPIEQIRTNPYQPRRIFDEKVLEELSQSIRENGIIQPLIVRKGLDGFELIAGERRLRAAKMAGLKHVPIVIRKSTDKESLELAVIENVQRHDLNCIEEALAYLQLIQDFSLTQEDIAKRVGKDRTTVANLLRLLRLPEAVILDLKKEKISLGHGKALLALEDFQECLQLHQKILEQGLSVRQTEEAIQEFKSAKSDSAEKASVHGESTAVLSRFKQLELDLTKDFSGKGAARVQIVGNKERGKIILHYHSREDLELLLSTLQNKTVCPDAGPI